MLSMFAGSYKKKKHFCCFLNSKVSPVTKISTVMSSVADPGWGFIPDPGSRILIFTHPGSRIPDPGSRIPDPGSKNSNKRER
jgi:hypothetical protein